MGRRQSAACSLPFVLAPSVVSSVGFKFISPHLCLKNGERDAGVGPSLQGRKLDWYLRGKVGIDSNYLKDHQLLIEGMILHNA